MNTFNFEIWNGYRYHDCQNLYNFSSNWDNLFPSEIFDKLYHYPLPLGSAAKSDFMQIRCLSKHLLVGGYGIKYDTLRLKTCICRCFLDVQWGYLTQNEELFWIDTIRKEGNGRWFLNIADDTRQKGTLWMEKNVF